MANPEHLKILKQGVEVWNKWREENPEVKPDLSKTNLDIFGMPTLIGIDFKNTNLSGVSLVGNLLIGANLEEANLDGSILANVSFARANLARASIKRANISLASFVISDLTNADIQGSRIYGISAWDIKKDGLIQKDLIITPPGEPEITVDDLEVAQFIYLMLNNQKIRDVIETITSKAVLILGRFTPERKAVLDALKDELRLRNYLPIVFDFENADSKSLNETMSLLARMSRFIVADITDAKAVREELALVIPQNPSVPVIPLVLKGQEVYSTFDFPKLYRAVLPLHEYDSPEILLENIIPAIIAPAEQKVAELRGK